MLSIREEQMADFFCKHHVEGLPFPAVLHHFAAPDGGDAHDHPFRFRSFVLSGGYVEQVHKLDGSSEIIRRAPGDRIIELPAGEAWTLIQPLGPKVQEPGFYRFREDGPWHRFWNETGCRPVDKAGALR